MKSFNQCLGCYAPLERQEISEIYHERCSRKLFGTAIPPTIDFGIDDVGKTFIIEVNDGFAFGHYGIGTSAYASCLAARWKEMVENGIN